MARPSAFRAVRKFRSRRAISGARREMCRTRCGLDRTAPACLTSSARRGPSTKRPGPASALKTSLRTKTKKRSHNREETLGEDYQTQLAGGVSRVRGDAGAGAAGQEHDPGGAVPAGRLYRRAGAAIAV